VYFVAVSQISDDGNDDSGDSGGLTTVSLVAIIIVAIIVLTTLVIIIVGVGVYCHRKLRFVYNILCNHIHQNKIAFAWLVAACSMLC